MAATARSKCSSVSKVLLVGSLVMFALAVVLFPIAAVFWVLGVLLAACGLLTRILGVQQMSLAAWMGMTLLLSVAILLGLFSTESDERLLRRLGILTVLPALVIWVLSTFASWLFVDHALRPKFGEKCRQFALCLVAPLAIVGTIVCLSAVIILLLALPFSNDAWADLGFALLCSFPACLSWVVVQSFRGLIRNARAAHPSKPQPTSVIASYEQ